MRDLTTNEIEEVSGGPIGGGIVGGPGPTPGFFGQNIGGPDPGLIEQVIDAVEEIIEFIDDLFGG